MAVCVREPAAPAPVFSAEVTIHPVSTAPHSSQFYSQAPEMQQLSAAASPQLVIDRAWSPNQRAIAATYNRLGNLFHRLSAMVNLPIAPALAVWFVESSGVPLTPGRAAIRFEVGKFLSAWGRTNRDNFDAHFQCGGHNGVAGQAWQNHAFRPANTQPFGPVHANSGSEYAALQLAQKFSTPEIALRCVSIGGCQILLSNFAMLGYASAADMFAAFQRSENVHVLGFFDFCTRQAGGLIGHLQQRDFATFATHYNGPGQVDVYAAKLHGAAADAEFVLSKNGVK